jgi:hypothetical protein
VLRENDSMREFSEERAIGQVVARLTARYPSLDPDRIAAAVRLAHEGFASSAVRDFVPLLVERHVREELDEGLRAAAV